MPSPPNALTDFLNIARCEKHNETQIVSTQPLHVTTPATQWSYAVSITSREPDRAEQRSQAVIVKARVEVFEGRVGVGWTRLNSDNFHVEKHVTKGPPQTVAFRVAVDNMPGRLMIRNAGPNGPSRFVLHSVDVVIEAARLPYPVEVDHRDVAAEAADAEGHGVFEDELARSINAARLEFVASLQLALAGKRVLDAGCGVGHHSAFYTKHGCHVVGVDGRADNIATLKRLYPQVQGIVADVQDTDLESLGVFDIVHCFGLLYHLESPVAALRRLSTVCRNVLLVETMVCDSQEPLMVLADENASANQALAGLGCRPSPGFVAMALDRIGFEHIYGSTAPPRHPDFHFEWRNNLDIRRDGRNLRCVFVASRTPVECLHLVELVPRA